LFSWAAPVSFKNCCTIFIRCCNKFIKSVILHKNEGAGLHIENFKINLLKKNTMAKSHDAKKTTKKEPLKTPKERKEEKREKKSKQKFA
jgi:hypothetical protein